MGREQPAETPRFKHYDLRLLEDDQRGGGCLAGVVRASLSQVAWSVSTLERVGLGKHLGHYPGQLSGGQLDAA